MNTNIKEAVSIEKIFLNVLNMTLTASFVIAVIIITRLFFKRTPKVISYMMWAVAGFRLIFPFSIESILSLMPFNAQPIPQDITEQIIPNIETGIPAIDSKVSSILPIATQQGANESLLQTLITAGAIIWILGIAVMLIYSISSTIIIKHRLVNAVLLKDNIYEAKIKTPFVMGIFKPRIYIPTALANHEKNYIILHERNHIKRYDNVIKILAYGILCLHWFNPLAWAAFMLMSTDMEMSCDERVLKETGETIKKAYSMSILSLATERRTINICPVAFGEGNTKRRIMNVLNYKKQSKFKIITTLVLVVVLSVGFTFNKASAVVAPQDTEKFQQAAEFLSNNPMMRIVSENDILTGEEKLSRKDLAFYVTRLHHPKVDFLINRDFFGIKQEMGAAVDAVFDEEHGGYQFIPILGDVPDFNSKKYDFSIKYCIENGIMTSEWLSEPETAVTFEEAVKILVTALRYDGIAENEYIKKAAAEEVRLLGKYAVFPFTGVSADKTLIKNDAVMLLYNFMMSDYAVDVEGTVTILDYLPDKTIDEGWKIYLRNPQNFNNMDGYPYNPNITRDEYVEKVLKERIIMRQEKSMTYRSVLNTFGAYIAKPTTSTVAVDGKEISFDAYNIDGSNYFNLYDISHVLNGTAKQFGRINGASNGMPLVLSVFVGEPNTQIVNNAIIDGSFGYKMAGKGTNAVTATKGNAHTNGIVTMHIYFSNKDNDINAVDRVDYFGIGAYEINGITYYKLRDLAEALNFNVEYNETNDTIFIDTNKPFPNRTPLYTNDWNN